MNKKLLQKVRDQIADESVFYDQSSYWLMPAGVRTCYVSNILVKDKLCGTPCCIAGHAVAAAGAKRSYAYRDNDFETAAKKLLELSKEEANLMFYPETIEVDYGLRPPTRQETVAMLDRAIETGEVRWEAIE